MKFVNVDECPKSRKHKDLQSMIEEFVFSDFKIAKIDFDENDYTNLNTAHSTIYYAIRRSRYDIKLKQRDGELYLVKGIV